MPSTVGIAATATVTGLSTMGCTTSYGHPPCGGSPTTRCRTETLHRILDHARFAPRQNGSAEDGSSSVRTSHPATPGEAQQRPCTAVTADQDRPGPWDPLEAPAPSPENRGDRGVERSRPVLTAAAVLVFCIDLGVVAAGPGPRRNRPGRRRLGHPLVWNVLLAARAGGTMRWPVRTPSPPCPLPGVGVGRESRELR